MRETALSVLQRENETDRIRSGVSSIDACTKGFLVGKGIVDIVGEASAGKTQFALQCCLQCRVDYPEAVSTYICTEGPFPMKRFRQLAESFHEMHQNVSVKQFLDSVLIQSVNSVQHLEIVLNSQIGDTKLVVVDSIAAPFRGEFSHSEIYERALKIGEIGTLLKTISEERNCCIITLNQVSDIIKPVNPLLSGNRLFGGDVMRSSSRWIRPALGSTWSNLLFMRIFITRDERSATHQACIRQCTITLAPHLPVVAVSFQIHKTGLIPL